MHKPTIHESTLVSKLQKFSGAFKVTHSFTKIFHLEQVALQGSVSALLKSSVRTCQNECTLIP